MSDNCCNMDILMFVCVADVVGCIWEGGGFEPSEEEGREEGAEATRTKRNRPNYFVQRSRAVARIFACFLYSPTFVSL